MDVDSHSNWELFPDAFSLLHTTAYSFIALQEAYLCTKFNSLYWACAVLTSNAGASQTGDLDEEEEEETSTVCYDKIARAIGDLKKHSVVVSPPFINKAGFSFTPDIKGNQIIYSLKAICGVSDRTAEYIIKNQPFNSFKDFKEKMRGVITTKKEMYSLIKAGAFDEFEPDRVELMRSTVKEFAGAKGSLNGQNLQSILNLSSFPSNFNIYKRYIRFKKYVTNKNFFYKIDEATRKNKNPKKWFVLDKISEDFFIKHFISLAVENKHYSYSEEGRIIICDKDFGDLIKKACEPLLNWIKTDECLAMYNEEIFYNEWNKYCSGTISKWEMDSLCYYYHEHEMANVNFKKYLVSDFEELPEIPQVVSTYKRKGREMPIFAISRIIGTVISKDNTKRIVTLLTPTGVVDVKFNKDSYSHYNKQLSKINPDGSKTIIEKSYFARGTKLSIVGYRRENQFVVKRYKDSIFPHTVQKILEIKGSDLVFNSERETV